MKLVNNNQDIFFSVRFNCLVLVDLRNELTKEQDSRQKLEQDILELRRVRSKYIQRQSFF
jgi:hypothetical protein